MPAIIRHELFKKVRDSAALKQLLIDFKLMSGLAIQLVDETGRPGGDEKPLPPAKLCHIVQRCQAGQRMCESTLRRLFSQAKDRPSCVACDAGLREAAVAVRISGVVIGFLRFAGVECDTATRSELHRCEHLLNCAGVTLRRFEIGAARARSPVVAAPVIDGYLRTLELCVRQITLQITAPHEDPNAQMPELVDRAIHIVRKRAMLCNLDLTEVARQCGVSSSHLSRVFHHATGLTFREYMARVRANHARDLLLGTDRSISSIALESGFQSFSQFNRVMRSLFGQAPREIRVQARSGSVGTSPVRRRHRAPTKARERA